MDGTWGPERSLSRMIDCSDERLSKQQYAGLLEDYCKQEEDSEFLDDEKINASELNEENILGILTVKTCG